jgi:ligand-binding sensor domain-containing protein
VKLSSPRRGYISDIASSGTTGRTLWVTVSSAGGGHVFRSTNSGNTWADRSAALPDIAVNAIVIDPKSSQRLYIATDRGVYRSSNSGTAWSVFSNGLPNVIVGDLLLHAGRRLLRAGTRSRGAWELSL